MPFIVLTLIKAINGAVGGEKTYKPCWFADIKARAGFNWGPVKYRSNARREHTGVATIDFTEGRVLRELAVATLPSQHGHYEEMNSEALNVLRKQAVKDIRQLARELKEAGYRVQLFVDADMMLHYKQHVGVEVEWVSDPPEPRLLKKLGAITLSDLR